MAKKGEKVQKRKKSDNYKILRVKLKLFWEHLKRLSQIEHEESENCGLESL